MGRDAFYRVPISCLIIFLIFYAEQVGRGGTRPYPLGSNDSERD
jgi:hypothetical protein